MFKKKSIMCIIIILTLTVFTSCNNKNNLPINNENKNNITQNKDFLSEYEINNEGIFDINKVQCSSLVDLYNNGFVFTGKKYNLENNFITLSKNINDLNQEITENILTIDQSNMVIDTLKKYKNQIYVLASYNGQPSLIVFDLNGKEITRLDLDYNYTDIQVNNNIYILDYANSKVHCYSLNLEPICSYDINVTYDNVKMIPKKLCISNQNDIYCLLNNKATNECKIITVGETSKIICNSIDDLDTVDDMYVNGSGNILIFGKNSEDYLVDEIDHDGKIIDMFEISSCDKIYEVSSSNHIIYSNSQGLYDYFGDTEQLLISSTEFSDKEIYSLSIDSGELSVYLNNSNSYLFNEKIFEVNEKDEIISEYETSCLIDCFVQKDKIYYIDQTDENIEVNIIENGVVNKTGICFDIDDVATCKIGVFENGNIVINTFSEVNCENTLLFYNREFDSIKEVSVNEYIDDFIKVNGSLYFSSDNLIYKINDKLEIEKTNIDIGQFGSDPVFCSGNSTYDFLFSNNTGFYGYKTSDSSCDLLINYSKLGILEIDDALLSYENKIYINSMMEIRSAQKVKNTGSSTSEKKNITISYFDRNDYVTEKVLLDTIKEYNKKNNEYNIEINKYASTSENDPVTFFERDLVTGKIPDIMILDPSMNIETYIKDNLFTDINTMINNDPEIDRDMFNTNILDAFSYDNKLYTMPLNYSFNSIQLFVDYKYNSFDELIDQVHNNIEPGKYVFSSATFADNIRIFLNDRTDIKNNKLNITEDDMRRFISFNKNYCEVGYIDNAQYVEKPQFMIPLWFNDPLSFYQIASNYDRELIVGYSDVSGVVCPQLAISVTEHSPYKEAAWEFIKQLFDKSDEIKKYSGSNDVSILKKYAVKPDTAEIPQNYIDEYNRLVEGKWVSDYYNKDILQLIISELKIQDNLTDEEKSKVILNKLEKYYAESR